MPIQTLSYSKISTFKKCSASYYYTYLFNPKLPRSENTGSLLGGIVHDVAETLGHISKKHYKLTLKLAKSKKLTKPVARLLKIKLKKAGILSDETFQKAGDYLISALSYDFWFDGCGSMLRPELEFNIDTDTIKMKGFLDRAALYRDQDGDTFIKIWDLKTQKQLFSPEDIENSIQALSYLMAAKTLYPMINLMKSRVDFIMVAHNQKQTFKLKNLEQYEEFIKGIEEYQVLVDTFNKERISSGLAKDKGFPKDKTFSGLLVCGIGVKNKGDLKKDGSLKYHCPFRFPFDYYTLVDKAGKVHYSGLEPKFDKNLELKQFRFPGCCGFYHPKITESVEDGEDENHYL